MKQNINIAKLKKNCELVDVRKIEKLLSLYQENPFDRVKIVESNDVIQLEIHAAQVDFYKSLLEQEGFQLVDINSLIEIRITNFALPLEQEEVITVFGSFYTDVIFNRIILNADKNEVILHVFGQKSMLINKFTDEQMKILFGLVNSQVEFINSGKQVQSLKIEEKIKTKRKIDFGVSANSWQLSNQKYDDSDDVFSGKIVTRGLLQNSSTDWFEIKKNLQENAVVNREPLSFFSGNIIKVKLIDITVDKHDKLEFLKEKFKRFSAVININEIKRDLLKPDLYIVPMKKNLEFAHAFFRSNTPEGFVCELPVMALPREIDEVSPATNANPPFKKHVTAKQHRHEECLLVVKLSGLAKENLTINSDFIKKMMAVHVKVPYEIVKIEIQKTNTKILVIEFKLNKKDELDFKKQFKLSCLFENFLMTCDFIENSDVLESKASVVKPALPPTNVVEITKQDPFLITSKDLSNLSEYLVLCEYHGPKISDADIISLLQFKLKEAGDICHLEGITRKSSVEGSFLIPMYIDVDLEFIGDVLSSILLPEFKYIQTMALEELDATPYIGNRKWI